MNTLINLHDPVFSGAKIYIAENDGQKAFSCINLSESANMFFTDPNAMRLIAERMMEQADELDKEIGDA